MRIEPQIDVRDKYVKQYWLKSRKALSDSRAIVVEKSEYVDPDRLKTMVKDLLIEKPMKDNLMNIWGQAGGHFYQDMENIIKLKADIPVMERKGKLVDEHAEKRMQAYAYERSAKKLDKILNSEAEAINSVIDDVIKEGLENGLSMVHMRAKMKETLLSDTMTQIENYQAERIARTEVIGACNAGSYEAINESGLKLDKEWLHSGHLGKNYRPEHVAFQDMGAQEFDYEYAPGLQFPGDPEADPGEICNCRCTIVYNG